MMALRYTFWICTLVLIGGLAGRLLVLASRTETGLESLRIQWRDATWGLFLGKRTPIHAHTPSVQAQSWLDKTNNLPSDPDTDAEILMGGAMVLDQPDLETLIKEGMKIEISRVIGGPQNDDIDRREAAEDSFESQCSDRCLQLAAMATELEPTNLEWWRLRAMLLWRHPTFSQNDGPRVDQWLEILEKAAQHDSDNALYDYLVAYFDLQASVVFDYSGQTDRMIVQDAQRFQRAVNHFEQGQSKPFVAIGDGGLSAVEVFLRKTDISIADYERIVNRRLILSRRTSLLLSLWRWQNHRAHEVAERGDIRQAVAMERENLRLLDQFTTAGDRSTAYDNVAVYCRVETARRMNSLMNEDIDLFSPGEIEDVSAFLEESELSKRAVEEALVVLNQRSQRAGLMGNSRNLVCNVIVGMSPRLIIVVLVLGIAATTMARFGNRPDHPGLGVVIQFVCLGISLAVTVVFFGLAPSEIIPTNVQAWFLTILVIVTAIGLASWIGWQWLRRRKFKFSLRTILIGVTVFGAMMGIIAAARPDVNSFTQLPFELSIPAQGGDGLDATRLKNAFQTQASWLWPTIQWFAYYGPYLTLGIWVALVAVVIRFYQNKILLRQGRSALTLPDTLVACSRSLGRSFFVLFVLMTILNLSLAPSVIKEKDQVFQDQMGFSRNPDAYWQDVEKVVNRVRSSHLQD